MTESKNVRFSYHRDPKNQRRVITLARSVEGDTLSFQYAVCQPPRWISIQNNEDFKASVMNSGDEFRKKTGRTIAAGRLEKHPISITLRDGVHPLDAVYAHFASITPSLNTAAKGHVPSFVCRTLSIPNPKFVGMDLRKMDLDLEAKGYERAKTVEEVLAS